MQEMTQTHLRNVRAKTKDIATTEQEILAANSLQSSAPTLQKKADHPAGCPAEKRKKRCFPFVALALVLV